MKVFLHGNILLFLFFESNVFHLEKAKKKKAILNNKKFLYTKSWCGFPKRTKPLINSSVWRKCTLSSSIPWTINKRSILSNLL